MQADPTTKKPTIVSGEHRLLVDGQTAVMMDCPQCGCQTPHKIDETGRTCGVCGTVHQRGGVAS
jgi:hypothetical protein